MTLRALRDHLKKRKIKVTDLIEGIFGEISARQETLNAFITLCRDSALESAEQIDRELALGKERKLSGIPIAIKDNICTKDILTTCGSRILQNFVPPYDATVIARLKRDGAIIVGKTNMDEFAMGSSTETSTWGACRNPWNVNYVCGGSSGGSAAIVADGLAPCSLGSDTGGSIRLPASFCGVSGLKPTYGRVSRYGLVAFASSLDQIGPFASSVEDLALLLQSIGGWDPLDATSSEKDVPDYANVPSDVRGLRIGVPAEFFGEGLSADVKQAIEIALSQYEREGAKLITVSLPFTNYGVPAYYVIAPAEASANLARYDGVKFGLRSSGSLSLREMYEQTRHDGFGTEVKRRIMIGTFALSSGYYEAYYGKATRVRELIRRDFAMAFKECDLLATPVAPTVSFEIGSKIEDPLQMYLSDIYTVTINLAGVPAMSIPCGFSKTGLPIGLQLIAPHFREDLLFQAGSAFQNMTDWHQKMPPSRKPAWMII